MTLEVIYLTRHGFRSNWVVDPSTGDYTSSIKTPTGIAADPPLTAHGVDQARELGAHLLTVQPAIERVYSSPYYRCLQTVEPFVQSKEQESLSGSPERARAFRIRGETGIGEWYGLAAFEHPVPASSETLKELFPGFDENYTSMLIPSRTGETIDQLHDRAAIAIQAIIDQCDRDGIRAVLLCSHAATIIALGRVLTGRMPSNVEEEDFGAYTCGLSVFKRRSVTDPELGSPTDPLAPAVGSEPNNSSVRSVNTSAIFDVSNIQWRNGKGVRSGWDCQQNSNCGFLSSGEERGWRFSGEESFLPTSQARPDAGTGLGVVVSAKASPNKEGHKHRL